MILIFSKSLIFLFFTINTIIVISNTFIYVKSQEFMIYNYISFINIVYNYSKLNVSILIYCVLHFITLISYLNIIINIYLFIFYLSIFYFFIYLFLFIYYLFIYLLSFYSKDFIGRNLIF